MSRYSKNHISLIGNLGDDPVKFPENGDPIGCRMSVATSRTWVDKMGERHESTQWHRVTVFGNRGRACFEHLRKGAQVSVEGRVEYSKYERDGETRYSTEIIADDVGFLGSKRDASSPDDPYERRPSDRQPHQVPWGNRKR